DANDWHYHYPPLFAILLAPLADPPPGADRTFALPFAVSVAVFYLLSVACLVWGVHALARAVEETIPCPDSRTRWWSLRLWPILLGLPAITATVVRGQVGLQLLVLLCGLGASLLRGQRGRAGLWLAAAICLKVIPAYLLIYPLWRRDLRCLAGCAAG